MEYYVGLDVSVKHTAICIVDRDGRVAREAALYTEPGTLAAFLHGTGLSFERVGLEAGPLSSWLYAGLAQAGLPAVCVEARHMQAAPKRGARHPAIARNPHASPCEVVKHRCFSRHSFAAPT